MNCRNFLRWCWWSALGLLVLPGCAAFYPIAGIPARYLPDEFRAPSKTGRRTIDLSLLRQTPPKTHLVNTGDVLAIYIEGVLGRREEQPPVNISLTDQTPPAFGFPIPVRDDGTISLPMVGALPVRDLTVAEVENRIRWAYTKNREILQPGQDRIIVSLQRSRAHRVLVIRQEGGENGGGGAPTGMPGALNIGMLKRGTGKLVTLPAYRNDVLHALAETGGLPGLDAENAIYIIRRRVSQGEPLVRGSTGTAIEPTIAATTPASRGTASSVERHFRSLPWAFRTRQPAPGTPTILRAQSPATGFASGWSPPRDASAGQYGGGAVYPAVMPPPGPMETWDAHQAQNYQGIIPAANQLPATGPNGAPLSNYSMPNVVGSSNAYADNRSWQPPTDVGVAYPGTSGGWAQPGPGGWNQPPAPAAGVGPTAGYGDYIATPGTAGGQPGYPVGPNAAVSGSPPAAGSAVWQPDSQRTAGPAAGWGRGTPMDYQPDPRATANWSNATGPLTDDRAGMAWNGTGQSAPWAGTENGTAYPGLPAGSPNSLTPYLDDRVLRGDQWPDEFEEPLEDRRIIRIPVRLGPHESTDITEQDIILGDGDIVFIESRDTEVFYTGGLLGGGQFTLPRDYDLDVLGAIAIAQSGRGGAGGNAGGNSTRSVGGQSALNNDVSISASTIIILRPLPDGQQVPIKINLYQALRDPAERVIIQPGDYIMLQYTRIEAVAAFVERHLFEGALFTLAGQSFTQRRSN